MTLPNLPATLASLCLIPAGVSFAMPDRCGESAGSIRQSGGMECVKPVESECLLDLPDGLPESFTIRVPFSDQALTVHLEKNQVFGKNTRFLVADGGGKLSKLDLGPDRSYLGRVGERADFSVSAVLTEAGLIANIIRPGQESIVVKPVRKTGGGALHKISVGDSGDHQVSQTQVAMDTTVSPLVRDDGEMAASNEPITTRFEPDGPLGAPAPASSATLPPSRVMDVLEYEIGVEIGSKAFLASETYNSNMATAQASAQSLIGNLDARYLRSAGIKHRLGTVIIRTVSATDPLRDSVTKGDSGSLSAFKNYWNDHASEVGTTHDLAVYHVKYSPSGIAYVNSVGTSSRYALSCGNGTTSWADGTIAHEFGHSWNLRHTGDTPISEYTYGDVLPSSFYESKPRDNSGSSTAGGSHVFVSIMHGSGDHNIGRLATDEANTVYSTRQNKRGYGTLVANPGDISPFGRRDSVTITTSEATVIDVVANDHDVNNDVLDAELLDTVSEQGGTISLSAGTGPGGRNELTYTPPAEPEGNIDFFHYTVRDSTGRSDWGAVYVTLDLPNRVFFEESFSYSEGELSGNQNDGNTWETNTVGGSATVVGGSLSPQSPTDLFVNGGSVAQVGSARQSIALPSTAVGGVNGSTVYISFIQQFTDELVGIEGRAKMVEFWNGGGGGDSIFSFGTDTNPFAPDYGLFIDKNGGNIPLDVGTADTDAHLIVLKVEYGASDADTISVFIDPGEYEPVTAIATANYTNLAFNRVGFGSFQGGSQKVDEIRIGNSFSAVVPIDTGLRFEESFNYSADDLAGRMNDGGIWAVNTTGGSTLVLDDSLSALSAPNLQSVGGRAVQTASHRVSIPLSAAASGGEDGTTRYIGFVQKFTDNLSGIENRAKMIEFWNGAASSNSIFSFGTDANPLAPDYGLFIDKNGGNVPLDVGSADNEAHLIVFKIEYGTANADTISVFVDPGETEPPVADGTANYTNLAFTRIGLGTFQGGSQEVDEIRVGTRYEAVVPIDTGLRFQESFDYSPGDLAGNINGGSAWTVVSTGGYTVVADDGASGPLYPGLAAEGGRAVQSGSQRDSITLPSAASGGIDGTTMYISFVQKFTDGIAGIENRSKMMEFWNNTSTNNPIFSFGTDTAPASPDYGLLIDKNVGHVSLDLGAPDANPHLIVFKVEYGEYDVDTVSVFVDPGATEPLVPDASASYTDLSFSRVGFGSFQSGSQDVDEIRIGLRYDNVVIITDPDTDNDGLPDEFERDYYGDDLSTTDGSDDLDRDGQTDAAEFIAGTDPVDAGSMLGFTPDGIVPGASDSFTLRWHSVPGKSYSIWHNPGLDPGGWAQLVPSVPAAAGETTSTVVAKSGAVRFYQIRVSE